VRRHQPLPALLPAIALLVSTLHYVRASPLSLLPPLGAALLLMALARHDAREHRWRETQIQFSRDIWRDLTIKAALLSLALMLAATLLSSISVQKIIEFGDRFDKDEQSDEGGTVAESLGVEQRAAPVQSSTFDAMRVGGLPRRHLLRAGPDLSDRVVMFVSISDPPSGAQPRFYWRSLSYDYYSGRGWFAGRTVSAMYDGGQAVMTTTLPFHRLVRQEVEIVGDLSSGARDARRDLVHVAGT
ncbi:MAG: hypothetical protein GY837_06625, partial [Bosea sp.]|uniref:hypothetical protein n=1 Tax=Bosea sp. (in: a-proteobacteria) TaxID=1871050 RepID=UPI0031FE8011|nr:hypothetical protein [Bosea sp. (in: a-proteobacteria)]